MLIQVVLLAAVVGLLVVFVRSQHGVRLKASKRVAFFAFLVLNAYAVLRPQDVSWVANRLGVGRGTDLLLYVLIVAFVFVVLNFYLRIRQLEQRITNLARSVALSDAERFNGARAVSERDAGRPGGGHTATTPEHTGHGSAKAS